MIIPDANLLLYAYDSKSPFHQGAVRWWQDCLSGSEPVGLCAVVLFSFIRIATSRAAFVAPLSVEEAASHVGRWMERSITDFLVTRESDIARALEWLEAAGSAGNLTTGAQIAAIASRHRATVHTADTDFQRFPSVRRKNPLLSRG
ncbi:MAG: TA system VapC family ribonuclease toxin [Acidobacteriota bacterium]